MSWVDLLLMSGVALVCATLAQVSSRYARGGLIVNVIVGFSGALLGVYLSREYEFTELVNIKFGKTDFPVIWAVLGSVLFLAAVSLLIRPGRR